jgi:hypothetical protein
MRSTGIDDELRGQVPVGFVVLKDGTQISQDKMQEELIAIIRKILARLPVLNKQGSSSACQKHAPEKSCAKQFGN